MHYDLRDLRLLVAIIEEGSIAAAARRAHLSVSALSERMKALEQSAGVSLLARTARGSVPTEAGMEVASYARAVLLQADRLDAAVAAWQHDEGGEIRALTNSNAIASFLAEPLARFLARHPAVILHLREALSDEVAKCVRADEADIGIAAGTADLSGLNVQPFRRDRLVLLVPPEHKLLRRRRVALSDALDEPFVGLDEGAAIQIYIAEHAARLGRALQPRIRLRSFDGVGRFVAAGAGVAVVPASTVTVAMREAGAHVVDLADAWAVRDLVICLPQDRPVAPAVARLAAALRNDSI